MTRFARAKGSKASNERREEEATPWHVMRQQLAEQLNHHTTQGEAETSYDLKEILRNGENTQRDEVWSDFGEIKVKSNTPSKLKKESDRSNSNNLKHEFPKAKINKNGTVVEVLSLKNTHSKNKMQEKEGTFEVKEGETPKKGKVKQKNLLSSKETTANQKTQGSKNVCTLAGNKFIVETVESSNSCVKRKIRDVDSKIVLNSKKQKSPAKIDVIKKKKLNRLKRNNDITQPVDISVETPDSTELSVTSSESSREILPATENEIRTSTVNLPEFPSVHESSTALLNSLPNKNKRNNNSKFTLAMQSNSNHSINVKPYTRNNGYNENQHRRNNFSSEKHYQTIIANGREIHIVKYNGFFIKKDDADELKRLRKKLVAQNIPKEKLETIMKLERRKAEKALAREKKKVCYHCRQFGHNFSDCPDIKDSDKVKTGVCFKCGSLEHSHFECKVQQNQEYRHAVCFVCKEQGHIARQCPLNSQGLYPKGGCCHLCGEVTHLRKDCPKAVEEKTSKSVTVDVLNDSTVEDIERSFQKKGVETKKKKVIKFK